MFQSKKRELIVPQSEHLRLVGAIALHWGNAQFDKPAIDFNAFVAGVALHDWGHGFFDKNEIGQMSDDARLQSMTRLANVTLNDVVAETVMQHHVLRLTGEMALYDGIRPKLQAKIADNIRKSGHTQADYLWVDRITNLADMVSYDFSFEHSAENTLPIAYKVGDEATTPITYFIEGSDIVLDPWPLSVTSLRGYVLAYQTERYPDVLVPTVRQYHIHPK